MSYRLMFFCMAMSLMCSGPALAVEKQFETGFLAAWWSSDNDDSGTQLAIPIRAGVTHGDFTAQLLNAFVYTSVDPDAGGSESLSSFVDTRLTFSYALKGRAPVDVLVGLGFNLPTGYTDFGTDELILVSLPPELLPITTFGEGFNVNPYVVLARQWERAAAGFGIGYLWRGEYDYSDMFQDFDPGDVLTVTAQGSYEVTDSLLGRVFAEYASYGKDAVGGDDYYQDGSLMLVGAGAAYGLSSCRLDGSISAVFRSKAKFYTETATPIDRERNYGDEIHADLAHTYFLNSTTSVRSHLHVMDMGENGYEKDSPFFNGGRMKFSVGTGIERTLQGSLKGTADLTLFTIRDKDNNYFQEITASDTSDFTYRGFILSAGLHMTF